MKKLLLLFILTSAVLAPAQTFSVVHTLTGTTDGANPAGGLTLDRAGNLYGTAQNGGVSYSGTVYRLRASGSGWLFEVLYTFKGSPDGASPQGRVTFGPDGALYGATGIGGLVYSCIPDGIFAGCGTVFKLVPPLQICRAISCPWIEAGLYAFQGGSDGAFPTGDLTFDQHGALYGTTSEGGVLKGQCYGFPAPVGCGTVYKMSTGGNAWMHTVVYAFQGSGDNYADGVSPESGVSLDGAGNVYGTAPAGGLGGYNGFGVVYQLSPSGSKWNESVLHTFTGGSGGQNPAAGLIFDQFDNLYGAAGGMNGNATLYELIGSDGYRSFNSLFSFPAPYGSVGNLTMDNVGNFYGTTAFGGNYGWGTAFKLTYSNGGWTYTSLHDFTGGTDGGRPISSVLIDTNGNLYGTASCGGNASCTRGGDGVVWEITR